MNNCIFIKTLTDRAGRRLLLNPVKSANIIMKINVYGRKIEVIRSDSKWKVFFIGSEGKKRMADNITVPSNINEEELISFLSDIFHEWASPSNSDVFEIK